MDGKLKVLGGIPKTAVVPPLLQEVGKLAASVASVNTGSTASGSATGNPRNKCALKPGHSLMDWIRLGSSGKDLTHVGSMAGKLQVSQKELAKHRTETDAWLAIRGKVYNVTDYLSFHPGGIDQLMLGVGRDSTDLFDNIHPWVNYEKILAKCFIGILTNTTDEVIVAAEASTSDQSPKKNLTTIAEILHSYGQNQNSTTNMIATNKPNFDWIQKTDTLYLYFYLGTGSNPYVEIEPMQHKKITINVYSKMYSISYTIDFLHQVLWPVKMKNNHETGKFELMVYKDKKAVWTTFGTMSVMFLPTTTRLVKNNVTISYRKRINYNCLYYELTRTDGVISNLPLGKHVYVFKEEDDGFERRSYSIIPCSAKDNFVEEKYSTPKMCLIVKRYPNGLLSPYITDKKITDELVISEPIGAFDLKTVMQPENFIMLAGGTGINPMLGITMALLDRRIKPIQSIDLMFFNRNEDDIILQSQLKALSSKEPRFQVEFILSQPTAYWTGLSGRVTEEMIRNTMAKRTSEKQLNSLFFLVCGSRGFGETVTEILQQININKDHIYVFPG